jgi:hypothetical protein
MAGFAFRSRTKHGGDIVVTFNVCLGGKVKITAVSLGFASEGVFEILQGLAFFKVHFLTPNFESDYLG